MTVEHVHVHPGAQAIVGNVNRGGEGPGVAAISEGQPYAKQLAHAPEPAMPGGDEARERVPVAGSPGARTLFYVPAAFAAYDGKHDRGKGLDHGPAEHCVPGISPVLGIPR